MAQLRPAVIPNEQTIELSTDSVFSPCIYSIGRFVEKPDQETAQGYLASGEYLWMYSDVGEGGNYACKDGVITLDNDPSHSANYDPETGVLTWDGIEYTQAD